MRFLAAAVHPLCRCLSCPFRTFFIYVAVLVVSARSTHCFVISLAFTLLLPPPLASGKPCFAKSSIQRAGSGETPQPASSRALGDQRRLCPPDGTRLSLTPPCVYRTLKLCSALVQLMLFIADANRLFDQSCWSFHAAPFGP